ncbi:MAG: hypothetical protein KAX28_02910 [Candidatus Marinimicrobia bacterium]|nr:hypothetical protein [Candidatus Neomarinimicrobiota bacterium]
MYIFAWLSGSTWNKSTPEFSQIAMRFIVAISKNARPLLGSRRVKLVIDLEYKTHLIRQLPD